MKMNKEKKFHSSEAGRGLKKINTVQITKRKNWKNNKKQKNLESLSRICLRITMEPTTAGQTRDWGVDDHRDHMHVYEKQRSITHNPNTGLRWNRMEEAE